MLVYSSLLGLIVTRITLNIFVYVFSVNVNVFIYFSDVRPVFFSLLCFWILMRSLKVNVFISCEFMVKPVYSVLVHRGSSAVSPSVDGSEVKGNITHSPKLSFFG